MSRRPIKAVVFLIIVPVAVAAWILSAMTLGDQITHNDEFVVGMSVAMLVVAASVSLLLLKVPANPQLSLALVICGAACILTAVALQFYLASVAAEIDRRAAEILAQNANRSSFQVNINRTEPAKSVIAIGYFGLFAGIWMIATGIRVGVGSLQAEEDAIFDIPAPSRTEALRGKPSA